MEFITVDYINQVKERIMPFLVFIAVPCFFWWCSVIIGIAKGIFNAFFTIVDEDDLKTLSSPTNKDSYDGDYLD